MVTATLATEQPSKLSGYGKLWKSYYARVNGIKTRFVTAGEGEPVVVLHGGAPGASAETNYHLNIAPLAEHFRVYGLDQVGYGRTDKPPTENVTLDDQRRADHLLGFLDLMCLEKVNLIGQSMGSATSAMLICQRPERVNKVIFVNLGGANMGISVTNPGRPAQDERIRNLCANPNKETMRAVLQGLMHRPESITDDLVEARLEMALMPGALEGHRRRGLTPPEDPNVAQRRDLRNRLPALNHPMILVWGKQDAIAPVEIGQKLKEALPNLKAYYELDNCGHHVQADQTEFFNKTAIEFLKS